MICLWRISHHHVQWSLQLVSFYFIFPFFVCNLMKLCDCVCRIAYRIERQFLINASIDDANYVVTCQCRLDIGFVDRQNSKIAFIHVKDVNHVDTVPINRVHSIDHIVHRYSQVNLPVEIHVRDNFIGITETTIVRDVNNPLVINDLNRVPYTHPS